jgi:hemolysin activation/secretion protein
MLKTHFTFLINTDSIHFLRSASTMTQSKTLLTACVLWGVMTPTAASAQDTFFSNDRARFNTVKTEASFLRFDNLAQSDANPNRDRFLQSPDDPLPQTLPGDDLIITPETDNEPDGTSDTTPLMIDTIEVVGNTLFTDADLAPILETAIGNTTLGHLQNTVDRITQLYVENGYVTSNAVLPAQQLDRGTVTIQVIEGTMGEITIEGLEHLKESYVTSRLGLGIDTPLNVNDLEDQLRLLQVDPNFDDFEVSLQPGDSLGSSNLFIDIDEANQFFGTAFIDNYSPRSVGSTRGGLNLGYRNLAGRGDVLSLAYTQTFANGLDIFDLAYSIPLNAMNGTLEIGGAIDRNKIISSPFDVLNIRGESESYRLSFRQPLVRTATEEFALSLGFTHKNGQTFLFNTVGQPFSDGSEANGTTKTSVFRFGQDYTKRDFNGAWSVRSQFSLGTALFDATQNSGATPDGQFFAWLGQVARVQRLNDTHTLIIQGDLQLSGDNLLASESFSLGGQQTLRGYRQGARSSDAGWRISIEDRITLLRHSTDGALLQLAPFFDYGVVWNNADNTSQISGQHVLAGVGTGIIIQPQENLTLRLDLTLPLVNLDDRQTDLQDDGIYFSLAYGF